ncbi:MAG: acetyl-CoA hydrolase/transferase C-terminal domain-containing protein [Rhodoferax sp.]|nr:acetyl-CoA hydrolase/transferase C-terminal domain-containing protein [Rhodoferax sp.]
MNPPTRLQTLEAAVEHILARTGPRIVLAIPLGIGKPNPLVNALYRRVKADPSLHLKIFTALSLQRPVGHSDLEKRFLQPFTERVFGDYPDLDYAGDALRQALPPNIEVYEFFMKTGDYLGNAPAQQHHIYCNYSHAARDMKAHGVNVMAQAIAVDESGPQPRYSLSSNPDVTLDLLDLYEGDTQNKPLAVGAINRKMPFMPNDAQVPVDRFDVLIDDPHCTHDPFGAPNMKVDAQDYAIALWASALVPDAGTLQIGIGSLGDGIAQALIVRDQHNADYRQMLGDLQAALGAMLPAGSDLARFEQGLYGCSEMFVNGFLWLIKAGIIRREVYDDLALQRLVSGGYIGREITPRTLVQLRRVGRIGAELTLDDVAFLKHHGIFKSGVQWVDGELLVAGERLPASLAPGPGFERLCQVCLGTMLGGAFIMHGGFFLGPRDFYQALRDMPAQEKQRINMSRISFINELLGHEELARLQRQKGRFINTTMMVTLLGAAVSDGLDSGQMVSGVGGQYNFVAMGHALPDARSILLLRAWRSKHGEVASNIIWNYGHTTIPRHLRDIVVTEYGVADLRGQTDAEVIKRLLAIADSRFQDALLATAKLNGKIELEYEIPDAQRNNRPDVIEAGLQRWHDAGLLPDFPLGTDFTDDELAIVGALTRLQHSVEHPLALVKLLLDATVGQALAHREVPERYLERMGLQDAHGLKDRLMRALFAGNF